MARGGSNRRCFPKWVERFYSPLNGEELGAFGIDDCRPALWRLDCGCYCHKSRHAVATSIRRAQRRPQDATCFGCPVHGGRHVHASRAARRVHAILCRLAALQSEPCTVVWEARPLEDVSAFDFWLLQWDVLVEVDGLQHVEGSHHGTDWEEQWHRDRAKEQVATAEGYHVVRLHAFDEVYWPEVLAHAMQVSRCAQGQVHLSPSYNMPVPVLQIP